MDGSLGGRERERALTFELGMEVSHISDEQLHSKKEVRFQRKKNNF